MNETTKGCLGDKGRPDNNLPCEKLSSSVKRNVGILCDELDHVSEMLHRTRLELQLVSQENEVLRRILRCPI